MAKKDKTKKEGGFSLVEMLVVLAITTLLSTLAIGYNKSSERQLRVYRDQSIIVSTLNRAKALSLERFNETPNNREICGVGIRFEKPRTFILFQDSVSLLAEENCADHSDYAYSGPNENIEVLSLGEQLEFANSMNDQEVLFIPPHLDVTTSETFPLEIPLKLVSEGSSSAIVGISAVGQITTQEVSN